MSKRKSHKTPMLIHLENWNNKPGNASIKITKEFIRKNGRLLEQVEKLFYNNGEIAPK